MHELEVKEVQRELVERLISVGCGLANELTGTRTKLR